MPSTTPDRLDELERRVAALEAERGQTELAALPTPPTLDPETFWALTGLRSRADRPGAVMIVGTVDLPAGAAEWQEGATTDDLLEEDWDRAADTLAALGHPVRIRLVREVMRGRSTARELTTLEGVGSSGQVYHHLKLLVAAGWLRARGGTYDVPPERVVPLLTTVLGGRR